MRNFLGLSLCLLLALTSGKALAGGAIQTNINGLPLHWDVGETLFYNPENGGLKDNNPTYDAANTLIILQDAFETWGNLAGVDLNIQQGVLLGVDVDATQGPSHYSNFLGTGTENCYPDLLGGNPDNCFSPIIFDADGEILDSLFGQCAKFSILGFAGFDDVDDGSGDLERLTVRRGQALFSGACLPPAETKNPCGTCQRVLSDSEIKTIITHEAGHFMGMDHSQVHPEIFDECNKDDGGCPAALSDGLPTMFPILVNGAEMLNLHRDDEAQFQRLYGNPGSDHCSVSGTVFARDGVTELRGAEVLAENVNPATFLSDAISFVSGAEAPRQNNSGKNQGNCMEDCGFYKITGLTPGETYRICVQSINPQFTGGSSIEPVDPPFQKFSNDCPEDLTVTCQCSETSCPEISGVNIVTDANPDDIDQGVDDPSIQDINGNSQASGGCSLVRPRAVPTQAWKRLQKSLLRFN